MVPIRAAFVDESTALTAALSGLSYAELARPTRCQPWEVKTLAAHILRGVERVGEAVETIGIGEPDPDPYVYYRSPLRADPARDVTRNRAAVEAASHFLSGGALAEALGESVARAIDILDRFDGDTSVTVHWGPVLRLEDYLATRVVELAVHGIDLADALGYPLWLTPTASASVAALLRALLPSSEPEAISWQDEELIRVGTGRTNPLADGHPGATAVGGLFPLIS